MQFFLQANYFEGMALLPTLRKVLCIRFCCQITNWKLIYGRTNKFLKLKYYFLLQLTASEILDSNGDATIQADAYCLVKNFDKVITYRIEITETME